MTTRPLPLLLTLAGALALPACGSDERRRPAGDTAAARTRALTEIGEVRDALDQAVEAVGAGDARRADELLSEGYVEHFEEVEGPLERVDAELKESLERTLSTTIRDQVEAGASAREISALVDRAKADLANAERKLR